MRALGVLLGAGLAGAWAVPCAGRGAGPIVLEFEDLGGGAYRVEGRFSVPVSSAAAWRVLADYDGLGGVIPSLKTSRLLEREPGRALVEQEVVGGVLFFTRRIRVVLRVVEQPFRALYFDDVSGVDFERYGGSWRIEEEKGGLNVLYSLEAKRRFSAPDFVAKGIFRRNAKELLEKVRSEILRRSRE